MNKNNTDDFLDDLDNVGLGSKMSGKKRGRPKRTNLVSKTKKVTITVDEKMYKEIRELIGGAGSITQYAYLALVEKMRRDNAI